MLVIVITTIIVIMHHHVQSSSDNVPKRPCEYRRTLGRIAMIACIATDVAHLWPVCDGHTGEPCKNGRID